MPGMNLGLGLGLSSVIGAIKKWFQADSYKADSVSPSLILDFANNRYAANSSAKNFSDILTFTRGSTGTYFNSAGVMQTAAVDTPRFDYDPATGTALGLLIEESRTNYITRSDGIYGYWNLSGANSKSLSSSSYLGFSNGANVDSTYYYGAVASPSSIAVTSGEVWSFTIYVKNSTTGQIFIGFSGIDIRGSLSTGPTVTYNPNAHTIANIVSTSILGGYKITFTVTWATSGSQTLRVGPNGVGTIDVYAAQGEKGAFPTSYIPTTTGAVTRSAESVSNTGSNTVPFSSWYNSTALALYVDFDYQYKNNIWANIANVSDGTPGNHVKIAAYANNMGAVPVTTGGAAQYSPSPQYGATAGARIKGVIAATLNDAIAYFNGTALASDTSVTMPTVTALYMGRRVQGDASEMINGHIRELRFYGQRITNSEMQRITT